MVKGLEEIGCFLRLPPSLPSKLLINTLNITFLVLKTRAELERNREVKDSHNDKLQKKRTTQNARKQSKDIRFVSTNKIREILAGQVIYFPTVI